ncbi:tetratricopeptide repeat protein [Aestuariibius sp. 2305UL40-4]|uniref:tetratricopeptide repeat protein n=1 Tax=Aestuariibius violaceus TaxID=3234132 RepID=UPI00345E9DB0
MHDICDGHIDTKTPEALADWNAMILAFLAHGTDTPVRLKAVLDRQPDLAMAQAARGLFSMLMGRRELVDTARDALRLARAAGPADLRTRAWTDALEHWLVGHPLRSIAALEAALGANPRDTLTMKVIHAIRFVLGDADGMRASVERVLPYHDESHPCRGYALGCHAFALEETGDYQAAETAGRTGLTHATDDAWGLHAVAHVCDMTARSQDGIRLIDDNTGAWMHCNNFRYHVWWHKALLHLDAGETDEVLALYDTRIRDDKTDDYRDIANATSLLMRLELEGVAVGDRWEELASFSESRSDDGCLVFADLHYMLALMGAEKTDETRLMVSRFTRTANPSTDMGRIYADPGRAAAAGLAAFGEGRYDDAFRALAAARPRMQTIGGSHAQRDVFDRMTVDAGLRAGHLDAAEHILLDRLASRANRADTFTETRRARIDAARREALRIPAE